MTGNCMTVTGETCGYWLGVKKTEKRVDKDILSFILSLSCQNKNKKIKQTTHQHAKSS